MKIFRNIAIIITVLFILWFIVSYIQITSQNLDFENETILSNWNLFKLFIQFISFSWVLPLCKPLNGQVINFKLAYGLKQCR